MCVVLSSPGDESRWKIQRFVELIGHDPVRKRFDVYFGVHAVNERPDGEPNFFKMLHPGNVTGREIDAWPLPRHPNEPTDQVIFQEVYGEAFEERGGKLYQKRAVGAWDSWTDIDHQLVVHTRRDFRGLERLKQDFEIGDAKVHVPFTSWTVGPFETAGSHLLMFSLQLAAASYERVILPYGEDDFRINGPQQVYDQLKFAELPTLASRERQDWEERLKPFDADRLSSREGYDVILLNAGNDIVVGNLVGATPAPRKPRDAERFI